jgi:hypothetical protein
MFDLCNAIVNASERSNRSKFYARNDGKYLAAGLEFHLDPQRPFSMARFSPQSGSLHEELSPWHSSLFGEILSTALFSPQRISSRRLSLLSAVLYGAVLSREPCCSSAVIIIIDSPSHSFSLPELLNEHFLATILAAHTVIEG